MEDAVRDRVLEHARDGEPEQALAVDDVGVGLERHVVGNAVDPRHAQHVLGHQVWDRPGEAGVVVTRVLGGEGQLDLVDGLEPEVDLLEHELCEELDEAGEVGRTDHLRCTLGGAGRQGHGAQVGLELLAQARAPELDHHLGAVGEARRVDLPDRRRTEWRGVEVVEHGVDRHAEGVEEDLFRHPVGHRGHRVAAPAERLDPLVGEQALCGRDELAQLHVRRAAGLDDLLHVTDRGRRVEHPVDREVADVGSDAGRGRTGSAGTGAADHAQRRRAEARAGKLGGLERDLCPGGRCPGEPEPGEVRQPGPIIDVRRALQQLEAIGQRRVVRHGGRRYSPLPRPDAWTSGALRAVAHMATGGAASNKRARIDPRC